MKKGIICILVILLLVVAGSFYYKSQEEKRLIGKDEEEFEEWEDEEADLEETPPKKVVENEKREVDLEEIPVGKIDKSKFKVSVDSDTCYYEKEGEREPEETAIEIDIANKKAYITMDSENELLKSIAQSENIETISDVDAQEIAGFASKPVETFFGDFGQDIGGTKLLFLMEDGSVEYIDLVDMLKNQSYKSQGKIKNLEHIKQFETLSVVDTEGGGYITTIAIDEDGYYYDLNQLL